MKFLLLIALLGFVVLFVAGVVAPRRSRSIEESWSRMFRRGEDKSDDRAGRVGDATNTALEKVLSGGETSARAGRSVRGKVDD